MPNFFIVGHGCYDASRPPIVLGRNILYFKSPKNSSAQGCAVDQDLDTTNYQHKVGGISGATVEDYLIDFVDAVDNYGFKTFDVIAYDALTGHVTSLNYNKKTGVYLSDILSNITRNYGGSNRIYLTVCRGPCHRGGLCRGGIRTSSKRRRKRRETRRNFRKKKQCKHFIG